jgi:hypothetical protein
MGVDSTPEREGNATLFRLKKKLYCIMSSLLIYFEDSKRRELKEGRHFIETLLYLRHSNPTVHTKP